MGTNHFALLGRSFASTAAGGGGGGWFLHVHVSTSFLFLIASCYY